MPTADLQWGRPVAGLQVSLAPDGAVRTAGALRLRLYLRSVGSPPPKIEPVKDAFGWLLVVQRPGAQSAGYYSDRVRLVEQERTGAGEEQVIHFAPIDLVLRRT